MNDVPYRAAFVCDQPEAVDKVYACGRREKIASLISCYPQLITSENFDCHAAHIENIEVIFSTWGMPALTPAQLCKMPGLKVVFYAAGSVKKFCHSFFEKGITVASAAAANAVPVAEFTLGQILLANKRYFANIREFRKPADWATLLRGVGNFDQTISLLGAGQIGSKVIELLKPFNLRLTVFDPFLTESKAAELGVAKVTLQQAFAESAVVSNHLADIPETVGLLDKRCFAAMPANATFINTGRGATVIEGDLIQVLRERLDLTALLDVTIGEPPSEESPLYALPNVFLSSHIAGSIGNEMVRMADYMIEEFLAWQRGDQLQHLVTSDMVATKA